MHIYWLSLSQGGEGPLILLNRQFINGCRTVNQLPQIPRIQCRPRFSRPSKPVCKIQMARLLTSRHRHVLCANYALPGNVEVLVSKRKSGANITTFRLKKGAPHGSPERSSEHSPPTLPAPPADQTVADRQPGWLCNEDTLGCLLLGLTLAAGTHFS